MATIKKEVKAIWDHIIIGDAYNKFLYENPNYKKSMKGVWDSSVDVLSTEIYSERHATLLEEGKYYVANTIHIEYQCDDLVCRQFSFNLTEGIIEFSPIGGDCYMLAADTETYLGGVRRHTDTADIVDLATVKQRLSYYGVERASIK